MAVLYQKDRETAKLSQLRPIGRPQFISRLLSHKFFIETVLYGASAKFYRIFALATQKPPHKTLQARYGVSLGLYTVAVAVL